MSESAVKSPYVESLACELDPDKQKCRCGDLEDSAMPPSEYALLPPHRQMEIYSIQQAYVEHQQQTKSADITAPEEDAIGDQHILQ